MDGASSDTASDRLIPAITIGGILSRFDLDSVDTADCEAAKLLPPGTDPPHYVRLTAWFLSYGDVKPRVLVQTAAMKAIKRGDRIAITISLVDDNG
jgi:hypothetical protein